MLTTPSRRTEALIVAGVGCGMGAGAVFTAFQILVTVRMGGGVFDYLRVIASIVLGPPALSPTYPLVAAVRVPGHCQKAHAIILVHSIGFDLTFG